MGHKKASLVNNSDVRELDNYIFSLMLLKKKMHVLLIALKTVMQLHT